MASGASIRVIFFGKSKNSCGTSMVTQTRLAINNA